MTVRFVVEREAMRRALRFVGPGVPRRSTTEAPRFVRIEAHEGGAVSLEAQNPAEEMRSSAEVPAVGPVRPGALYWRPAALAQALDACDRADEITFELSGGTASLTDGRLTARAHQPDAGGWVLHAQAAETWRTVVPAEQWAAMAAPILAHMTPAATRSVLGTAWLGADDQGAYVASADGFRLYTWSLPEGPPVNVCIPRAAWCRAAALRGAVTIALSERGPGPRRRVRLSAAAASVEVIEPFNLAHPLWRRLVPGPKVATRATVDGPTLRRVLRGVRALARDGGGIVRLNASPGALRLSVRGEYEGDGCEVVLPAMVSGPTARVALNHRYLAEVAAHAPGPVEIGISGESSVVQFAFAGRPEATAVVMPMYVAAAPSAGEGRGA